MANRMLVQAPKERSGVRLLMDVRRDPLGYFTKLMHHEGAFAWLNLNGQLLLMLNDAMAIQHVLQDNHSNYKKANFNRVLRPLLGNGIFLSEGNLWRKQRQEAAPVFATGNFEVMIPQMIEATEAMLRRWEPRVARNEPIDITVEMMQFTLDVLLRALFHEARDGIAAEMQEKLGSLLREAEGRIWSAVNLPQKLVLGLPKYRRAMQFLDDIVSGLITERRANHAYPEDLLSRLVASYDLSIKEQQYLRDQVMSFLLAGHETTAHGLAWSFYNLGRHPLQRHKMQAEIDEALNDGLPNAENLKKLIYSRYVFDEALRLYPPVWTMSREAIGDDVIPFEDGRRIPVIPGVVTMLCGYAVHRREKYWHDPDAFYPERFRPDAVAQRPKFAWFPFGGGARLCLGFRFAQVESLIAMAMIMQRYSLSLLPGQNVQPQPIITLRPSGPILFDVRPRNAVFPETVAEQSAPSPMPIVNNEAKCPFHFGRRAG